jgi:hypothetical protein
VTGGRDRAVGIPFPQSRTKQEVLSLVIGRIRLEPGAGESQPGRHRAMIASLAAVLVVMFPAAGALPARASTVDQWALAYLKASQAWQVSKGAGVTVAVVDTGVTPVPDLRPNLLRGHDFVPGSTSPGTGQVNTDPEEHGT